MKKTTAALALSVAVILGWACNQDADVTARQNTETVPMHVIYMSEEKSKQFDLEAEKLLSRIHGKPMRLEDVMRKLEGTRK